MNIMEVQALKKSFKVPHSKETVEAVHGINLSVKQGEIFGFLGPNGAGKSTTLRILSTLVQADGGRATIAGHDLQKDSKEVRRVIGYVGQAGGTDEVLTASENLILQARLHGINLADAKARASELIKALELEQFAERVTGTYSGGQRRRVDLALGMVHRPKLLFLDEPTTGLDPQSRARLWDEVRALRSSGTTVFLTTHYLDEADALCDRLAIIDYGEIVAEGTPDDLKRQIAGDRVVLGLNSSHNDIAEAYELLKNQSYVREIHQTDSQLHLYVENGEATLPSILRLLDSEGLTIQSVALSRPSLDDVFLKQTGRSLRDAAN